MASAKPTLVQSPRCKLLVFKQPFAIIFAAFCSAIFAACAPLPPASAPPQLQHTPGAFIEIAAGRFNAGDYKFEYPPSWRLVKHGAASADGMHIILQAPTGGKLSISVVQKRGAEDAIFIPLAKGNFLMAAIDVSDDPSPDLNAEFERIIRSIRS